MLLQKAELSFWWLHTMEGGEVSFESFILQTKE